jgi:hypothetical protein
MLQSTFLLSLLTGLSLSAALPADSALPSFAIVTPGATIEPASTPISVSKPTSTPVDNDQPDPYNSSIQVPASESFNPSNAPAFTPRPGVPSPSVYPSTPCSSEATPTAVPELPGNNPSIALPIETPTLNVPSNGEVTPVLPSSATLPIQTPTPDNGEDDDIPCDEDDDETETPSDASRPLPSHTVRPPFPTGGRPTYPSGAPYPSGIAFPSNRPAFGWGRPRPTGAFPSRGAAHPTHHFGHPLRPSAGFPQKGAGPAATTPCTLETRVRPTSTAALRV